MLTCISGRGLRSCIATLRFQMLGFKLGPELLVLKEPVLVEWNLLHPIFAVSPVEKRITLIQRVG